MLADFHNHSCLSPCGSLDLSPRVLVEAAAARGVQILALTDHNTSLNCPAFKFHCKRLKVIPFYGLEVTTQEEIHVLVLFAILDAALAFGDYIYSIITPFPNNPEKTGDQVYVDTEDNIEGELEFFLSSAAAIGIDELGPRAAEFGAIVIPAHVDRPAFSMFSQFGVVVKGPWTALECVRIPPVLDTLGYPLISGSDAHYPEHIARRPFELDTAIDELLPHGFEGDADPDALKRALEKRPR
ncbi:MAG: PHP domain-containing protein [Treponema sp.]|jgi:PHP family Zn ribbon phosphoesterase|nr:PHP domain-containing protein [Treponema sp.]